MKVTLKTLFEAHPAFQVLANEFFYVNKIGSVRDLVDNVNIHYKTIAQEQQRLLEFYGKKQDEGKYDVEDEKKPFYERELEEFLAKEVDIAWEPVPVDQLGNISLSLRAYELLGFLFSK